MTDIAVRAAGLMLICSPLIVAFLVYGWEYGWRRACRDWGTAVASVVLAIAVLALAIFAMWTGLNLLLGPA